MQRTLLTTSVLALATLGSGALLAQPAAKPPKAMLWMDVATGSFAGMPDLDQAMGGLNLGGLMGGAAPGGSDSLTTYGQARGLSPFPPRVLDIALLNTVKPATEAAQLVPAGLRMGEALPLLPRPPSVGSAVEREPGEPTSEKPKGRILIYWGCSETVRTGQPRIINLAGNPAQYASAFGGRYAPDRGARIGASHVLFPNVKNRLSLSQGSSLVGEHQIRGEGVPASMRFTLGPEHDLMPPIQLQTTGSLQQSVNLSWQVVPHARAYYLNAFSAMGDDLVIWSSADTGDTGMGLFDYLPNETIDRWTREKVLLQSSTTRCAIPQGIFAGKPGAAADDGSGLVRMIAYGSESNFAYPPRPADPKAAWSPEWTARLRNKAQTMAILGEETAAAATPTRGRADSRKTNEAPAESPPETANPVNLLRGIFGR